MRSFVEIKSSRNGEISLSFTDLGKSCPHCEFLASQKGLLMLFAKIKLSRKFPDLQYVSTKGGAKYIFYSVCLWHILVISTCWFAGMYVCSLMCQRECRKQQVNPLK